MGEPLYMDATRSGVVLHLAQACTCEPDERDDCAAFACVVCARAAPACCGAADEHETEGVGVSGVCDDCAARAAWEGELW